MLKLPSDILSQIYSEWLGVESIVRLDSATTNRLDRERLLNLLQGPSCALGGASKWSDDSLDWDNIGSDKFSLPKYEWLLLRGYNAGELFLAEDWWNAPNRPGSMVRSQAEKIKWLHLHLYGYGIYKCFDILLDLLKNCSRLSCITIEQGDTHDTLPQILSAIPQPLRKLAFYDTSITSCFPALMGSHHLKTLKLSHCHFDNHVMTDRLEGCKFTSLGSFRMETNTCGSELSWLLRGSVCLQSLSVHCLEYSCDQALPVSAALKQLSITIIRHPLARECADALGNFVRTCTAMENCQLNFNGELNSIIDALPSTIVTLDCSTLSFESEASLIRFVSRAPKLERLVLGGFELTNSLLETVASNCPLLQELNIFKGAFESTAIVFQGCPRLVVASLLPIKLRDCDVAALVEATPNLKELGIDGSLLTAKGIRGLQSLACRLRRLTVKGHRSRDWTALKKINPLLLLDLF